MIKDVLWSKSPINGNTLGFLSGLSSILSILFASLYVIFDNNILFQGLSILSLFILAPLFFMKGIKAS